MNNNEIRKITVGIDYKNSMHYLVGQDILNGSHKIHAIVKNEEGYYIWIENNQKEIYGWKNINNNLPIIVEFNINY